MTTAAHRIGSGWGRLPTGLPTPVLTQDADERSEAAKEGSAEQSVLLISQTFLRRLGLGGFDQIEHFLVHRLRREFGAPTGGRRSHV
jgi:hypothetical protein